ncbi:hypothetical protein PG984_010377 [Apiospora sp. TS-2023a]
MAHRKDSSSTPLPSVPAQGQPDDDLQSPENVAPSRTRANERSDEEIPRRLRGLSLLEILNVSNKSEDAHILSELGLGVGLLEPPNTGVPHQSRSATELFACPFLQHNRTKFGTWKGCQSPYYTISSIRDVISAQVTYIIYQYILTGCTGSTLQIHTCKSEIKFASVVAIFLHLPRDCLSTGVGGISCFRQDDGNRFKKSLVTAETLVDISKIEAHTNTGSISAAQRWRLIFGIIFPEEDIPSPYFDFNADESPSYVLSGMPTSKQGQRFTQTSRPEEMKQKKSVIVTKICMPKSGPPTAIRNLHRERFDSVALPKLGVFLKLHREAIKNTVAFIRRHAQSEDADTKGKSTDPDGSASQSLKRKGVHHMGSANGKHGQSPNDNKESDTDEEGDSRPPKVPRAEAACVSEDPKELLACPFYQHCPERYQVKNCVGPGWRSVSKVKEHLFRRHKAQEHRCLRCGDSFDDISSLKAHMRELIACPLRELTKPEGMDGETQARVRSKKGQKHLSEFQRWTELYKVLFPGEKIPVPYYSRCAPSFQNTDNDACDTNLLLLMAETVDTQLQDKVFETSSRNLSTDTLTVQDSQAIVKNAYNNIMKPFSDTISAEYMPNLDMILAEVWESPSEMSSSQAANSLGPSHTMASNAISPGEWNTTTCPQYTESTMLERPVGVDVAF